ncbi:hypothetical protein J2W55_004605 [Mucilaginibacter pocheonensis]|uniref:Uncharacterized protein n=1 Tax=Mucilaginibacter pocheonensis TaxID=398050 RepID=A0ABU1TIT7_9SPHI|nr:hypothetical protein [Mucilaginibacter pocheonensis]
MESTQTVEGDAIGPSPPVTTETEILNQQTHYI